MQRPPLSQQASSGRLTRRLDHVFGEINVVLVALAIGLAALDLTCFITLQASVELTRANAQMRLRTPTQVFASTAAPLPGEAHTALSAR